jgi:hypothetical protein
MPDFQQQTHRASFGLWLIKARLVTGKLMCKLNGRQVVSKVLVALA